MRLRKHEEMKVLDALERDYESPREAATSIFNLVVDLLAQRQSYAIGIRYQITDTSTLVFGPFWDNSSANRFASKMAGLGLIAFKANVYRPTAPVEPEPSPWCHECGDPESAHNILANGKKGQCLKRGCGCGRTTGQRRRTS